MTEIVCLLLMIFTGSVLGVTAILGLIAWNWGGDIIPRFGGKDE